MYIVSLTVNLKETGFQNIRKYEWLDVHVNK